MGSQLRNKRGITLIALVITIIVLLILAGVSISMISSQDGILNKAVVAKERKKQVEEKEALTLISQGVLINGNGTIDIQDNTGDTDGSLKKEIEKNSDFIYKGNGIVESKEGRLYIIFDDGKVEECTKIIDLMGDVPIVANENLNVIDEYGNIFVLPKGFKIVVDYTTGNAKNVTQGIVIEDASANDDISKGNQFVWVPVGKIYTDINMSEAEAKDINLKRCTFDNNGKIVDSRVQLIPEGKIYNATIVNENSTYFIENKELNDFVISAKRNHGYYIGRYEAGDDNATKKNEARNASSSGILVCKANQQVYNFVTRELAIKKSKEMYSSNTFKSDLINSFAWDTAIACVQDFEENKYSTTKGKSEVDTSKPQITGINRLAETSSVDKQFNIYDMAGNVYEWTTENFSNLESVCVHRGGAYSGE